MPAAAGSTPERRAGSSRGVLQRTAARAAAAGGAIAQSADRERPGTILRERGDELLQEWLEGLALSRPEAGEHVVERDSSTRQDVGGGPAALRRQVKRTDPMIGPGPALDEPVGGQAVRDLDARRLGDTQHIGKRVDRFAGIRIHVNQ